MLHRRGGVFSRPVVRVFSGTQSVADVYYCWLTSCSTPRAVAVNPSNGFVYVADVSPHLHVFSQTQFIADVFGGSGPAIQANPATGYVYADLYCGWLGIVSGTQYITDFQSVAKLARLESIQPAAMRTSPMKLATTSRFFPARTSSIHKTPATIRVRLPSMPSAATCTSPMRPATR